jgi:uncharacterized BrkB/YihY/UPF0761 family membrane protein
MSSLNANVSSAYQGVKRVARRTISISLTYGQIFLIIALAMSYLVVASLGIDMFSKCEELKGKILHENFNKWLIATLAIAITIPATLLITKLASSKLTGLMALLFAVMGIVGSSAVIHWGNKCAAEEDDDSKQVYGGINMAIFIIMLLVALFLLRPNR